MGIAERRKREKEIRRNQILEAAKEIFIARGFSRTTMEEIAEKTELSPATLYLYFKNKHDLYASFHLDLLDWMANELEKLEKGKSRGAFDLIRGIVDVLYNVYESEPQVVMNVFRLQASDDLAVLSPDVLAEMNSASARAMRAMARIFRKGIQEGHFKEYNPMAMADLVWAVFSGLVLWEESKRLFNPKKKFLKTTLATSIEILANGSKKV